LGDLSGAARGDEQSNVVSSPLVSRGDELKHPAARSRFGEQSFLLLTQPPLRLACRGGRLRNARAGSTFSSEIMNQRLKHQPQHGWLGPDAPRTSVSIVVVCRSEERFIAGCLDSIIASDYPKGLLEVLVVDGMSADRTRDVVRAYEKQHPFIRLIENPRRTTPAAMNLGILSATGSVVVINSAHAAYPADFISKSVEWLTRTGADVVGGPVITFPGAGTSVAKAIALGTAHRFGVGNSKFRTSSRSGYVDTVPFGAYRREIFERVGLFDERLTRNQDNELCSRVIRRGGKIFMTSQLTASYFSRPTLSELAKQAFRNGLWNVLTVRITPAAFRWRHFTPFCFVGALLGLGAGSVALPWCRPLLLVLACLYGAATVLASVDISCREGFKTAYLLPLVFCTLHVAYGAGTWCGLARLAVTQWEQPVIPEISRTQARRA